MYYKLDSRFDDFCLAFTSVQTSEKNNANKTMIIHLMTM